MIMAQWENGTKAVKESEDDFFGSQGFDDTIDNPKEFGGMAEKDFLAKESELRNIGYLDAYDAHKESMLQEGFEFGTTETFDVAVRIGKILGKMATLQKIGEESSSERQLIKETVRRFFADKFQKGEADNCKQELEDLEQDLHRIILSSQQEG
jgi:hypothetical protein